MCKDCCTKNGCTLSVIVKVLVVIGGINWGLVGLGMLLGSSMESWNVVNMILGSLPVLEAIVYVLVGVAAIMYIFGCKCGKCIEGACVPCGSKETPKVGVDTEKTEGNM